MEGSPRFSGLIPILASRNITADHFAAYNHGSKKVRSAIQKAGAKNACELAKRKEINEYLSGLLCVIYQIGDASNFPHAPHSA